MTTPTIMRPAAGWHAESVDAVAAALGADLVHGLSTAEAERRLATHGPNRLPDAPREGALRRFLKQFHNVLIYVLLVSAGVTASLGEWVDTWVILGVVVINAVIGFVQEGKAEQAMEGIRQMLSLDALVVRDGRRERIPAEQVVPGDVVVLESGDRVPADLRLVRVRNAQVEEAALTGESVPVTKQANPVGHEALLGDRRSMAYSGTLVTSGRLTGLVTATGTGTEIGRIGELVSQVQRIRTPLLEKMDRFATQLAVAILGISAALFAFGWLVRGYALGELFVIVVSFAVAAIPEGLPAVLTITLALGVQRMAHRKAILRRLPAVETLGSVTVICSDKTGTLTRNEMTVKRVLVAEHAYHVTGSGYLPEGGLELAGVAVTAAAHPALPELARVCLLCNEAEFRVPGDGSAPVLQGDPTEGALLVFAGKAGVDPVGTPDAWPRLDLVPFESEHRFMATLHADPEGRRWILLKGAPERVLDLCTHALGASGPVPLDAPAWLERIDGEAAEGFRMLALASRPAPADQHAVGMEHVTAGGFTLLGVAGIIDPPRPEAIEAVARCQAAGIRVKMITGDHALTARAIGAQLGMSDVQRALTGREIETLDDTRLAEAAQSHDVFARASPEHKLRLVRALQARQEVAAMTGDGVNDAPALEQADIGIAMGMKGTEAAKSAAEMVLADDNFATIACAVEEGRTVYDNLRKTILFILPTNAAEGLMVIIAVGFAFAELPISPLQILWVNMVTAVTLALALAFEPSEAAIMTRPPRPRHEAILSGQLVWRVFFVSALIAAGCLALFLWELEEGVPPMRARTLVVNALVAGELFYLFNTRHLYGSSLSRDGLLGNPAALLASLILVGLQVGFTYLPPMQRWFGTTGLTPFEWLLVVGVGVAVFLAVEVEKAITRRRGARTGD